jgi:hypothetical protein
LKNRATIHSSIMPDAVIDRLPPRFRQCVNPALLACESVDLFVFESGEDKIVTSIDLQAALDSLPQLSSQWMAVGEGFTREAMQMAASQGGMFFASRPAQFDWTDESWIRINRGLRA